MEPRLFIPFADFWLERELEKYALKVENSIHELDESAVVSSDISELSERLVAEYQLVIPAFDFDRVTETWRTRHVPDRQFPGRTTTGRFRLVRIPFLGDGRFLECYVKTRPHPCSPLFYYDDSALCFEIWPERMTTEMMAKDREEHFEFLRQEFDAVPEIVKRFNVSLASRIRIALGKRSEVAAKLREGSPDP